ncbi:MAG: NAD-dependent epimerase/dehydratase family protein [Spirochaetota bacterium]
MKKSVFVAGASGFIGIRVCNELIRKGYEVHAHGLVKPGAPEPLIKKSVKYFINGDLLNPKDCANVQKHLVKHSIDRIIYAAGSVNYKMDYQTSKLYNVDTVKNFLDIAEKIHAKKKLKKIVFLGSVASRGFLLPGKRSPKLIDETSDYYAKGLSVYCDVKREMEDLIRESFKRTGIPAVIAEPGSLVGGEIDGMTTTNIGLIRKISRGIPVLGGGASYTSAGKVAEGIVLVLEKGGAGESYLLGGENMPMINFAFIVRAIIKKNAGYVKAPFIPVIVLPDLVAKALGNFNIILSSQQALLGSAFHYIDSGKAMRELGYSHMRADLESEIIKVLEQIAEESHTSN